VSVIYLTLKFNGMYRDKGRAPQVPNLPRAEAVRTRPDFISGFPI
jgi:hypothetical protein